MYIYNYDLARNPEAVVAGWLYFHSIAGYDCDPTALYVDTAISLEPDFIDKEHWWEWAWAICSHLPDQPTAEALQVARQVFSGQVPDWFHDSFQKTNGQWDYQKIWTAAINTVNTREILLPMLRNSFGGYCSERDVANAFYHTMDPLSSILIQIQMAQPWRDGGCGQGFEPENDGKRPISGDNELSLWIKSDIVDRYGSESPWLQEMWDYTNRPDFEYVIARPVENSVIGRIFRTGSASNLIVTIGEDVFPEFESRAIYVSERVINDPRGLFYPISELAEVYIASASEIAGNPEAVAAGWLYFAQLSDCSPGPVYVQTAILAEPFRINLNNSVWQLCPGLPDQPTAEAKKVVRQTFSGQIPDWFHDNFKKTNGQWDYQKIWTVIENTPPAAQIIVVPMLRNSFGGYCSEEAVQQFLNREVTSLGAPWRDAGTCQAEPTTERENSRADQSEVSSPTLSDIAVRDD